MCRNGPEFVGIFDRSFITALEIAASTGEYSLSILLWGDNTSNEAAQGFVASEKSRGFVCFTLGTQDLARYEGNKIIKSTSLSVDQHRFPKSRRRLFCSMIRAISSSVFVILTVQKIDAMEKEASFMNTVTVI
jgi:hypothetical protein